MRSGIERLVDTGNASLGRRHIETGDGIPHLRAAATQRVHVLGALPLVQRQGAFHFPDWQRGDVRDEGRHQPPLGPVVSEQPLDVVGDGVADPRGDIGKL